MSPSCRPLAAPRAGGSTFTETQPEALIRAAHAALDEAGMTVGVQRVTRIVRAFKRDAEPKGMPFGPYLVNAVTLTPEQRRRALACDELRCVISWADPTGETAVHNVMRAGGGR